MHLVCAQLIPAARITIASIIFFLALLKFYLCLTASLEVEDTTRDSLRDDTERKPTWVQIPFRTSLLGRLRDLICLSELLPIPSSVKWGTQFCLQGSRENQVRSVYENHRRTASAQSRPLPEARSLHNFPQPP